jgi:glycosyltransferase involved in cell wall biosynthesis
LKIDLLTHLSLSYFAGGEREMVDLGIAMRKRGHDVTIRSLPYTLDGIRRVKPEEVLEGLPYVESWVHRSRADVAYVFYHPFCGVNFHVSGKKIAAFHSLVWFTKRRKRYGLVPRLAASLSKYTIPLELQGYDAIHVHDRKIASHLRRFHAKTWVIEHAVDLDTFKPTSEKDDRFTILYAGRPVWQKGWDRFETLASKLSKRGIRFVFVGGYAPSRSIQSYGFVLDKSKLAEIYSKAHLVLIPQRVETLGRSELEAMACGTPVITTAKFGSLESIALIKTAPEDLELRSLELFESWKGRNGYDELAKAARRDCARAFSFKSVMDKYEQMFKSVLDGSDVGRA